MAEWRNKDWRYYKGQEKLPHSALKSYKGIACRYSWCSHAATQLSSKFLKCTNTKRNSRQNLLHIHLWAERVGHKQEELTSKPITGGDTATQIGYNQSQELDQYIARDWVNGKSKYILVVVY